MKTLIVGFILALSVFAQAQSQCGVETLGGPEPFPFNQGKAQPFPWASIQGIWTTVDDPNILIKFKVTRESQKTKHLNVEIYSKIDCKTPLFKGVGLISRAEKNVIRAQLMGRDYVQKLMKLAVFDPDALLMDKNVCSQNVWAATIIDFEPEEAYNIEGSSHSNMVLKKITSSIDLYCRRNRN